MASTRLSLRSSCTLLPPRTILRPASAAGVLALRPTIATSSRRTLISTSTPSDAPPVVRQSLTFEGAPQPGLRMVLFGKPGSGKGTLSQRVLDTYPDVNLVSVGDVLRKEIAEGSEVGRKAKELVARGEFVPDLIMLRIALRALEPLAGQHWILDGFPRTVAQAKMLDEALVKEGRGLNLIVNLGVSDSVILRRIEDRYVHVPSGRVYNSSYNRPKVAGIDDVTGEKLEKRPDDRPEVFQKRLELYNRETFPLLAYYGNTFPELTHSLKGDSSDEIWPQLKELLEREVFNKASHQGLPGKKHSRD